MLQRTKSFPKLIQSNDQIYKVLNNLYIGSGRSAWNIDNIKQNNISHIVNAAPQTECSFLENVIYYKLNILDSSQENILIHLHDVNKFISTAINSGGSVLIHCHAGISRAPTICAAYLIQYHNFPHDLALKHIKKYNCQINPNKGFQKQLEEFYNNNNKDVTI